MDRCTPSRKTCKGTENDVALKTGKAPAAGPVPNATKTPPTKQRGIPFMLWNPNGGDDVDTGNGYPMPSPTDKSASPMSCGGEQSPGVEAQQGMSSPSEAGPSPKGAEAESGEDAAEKAGVQKTRWWHQLLDKVCVIVASYVMFRAEVPVWTTRHGQCYGVMGCYPKEPQAYNAIGEAVSKPEIMEEFEKAAEDGDVDWVKISEVADCTSPEAASCCTAMRALQAVGVAFSDVMKQYNMGMSFITRSPSPSSQLIFKLKSPAAVAAIDAISNTQRLTFASVDNKRFMPSPTGKSGAASPMSCGGEQSPGVQLKQGLASPSQASPSRKGAEANPGEDAAGKAAVDRTYEKYDITPKTKQFMQNAARENNLTWSQEIEYIENCYVRQVIKYRAEVQVQTPFGMRIAGLQWFSSPQDVISYGPLADPETYFQSCMEKNKYKWVDQEEANEAISRISLEEFIASSGGKQVADEEDGAELSQQPEAALEEGREEAGKDAGGACGDVDAGASGRTSRNAEAACSCDASQTLLAITDLLKKHCNLNM